METRTYWLSFCDTDRPPGDQFLGVVVVDVTAEEALAALAIRPDMGDREHGPWIAGAIRGAWRAQVNPGGCVASVRIDGDPRAAGYPRLTLLNRADVAALEPPEGDPS